MKNSNKLKILITSQVFPPEFHPTGVMVKELATDLVRCGHDVTVATGFPNHPFGQLYPGFQKKWVQWENQDGVQVIRVWHVINSSPAFLTRALVQATQTLSFFLAAAKADRPDVVVAGAPPIVGPLVSGLICKACGAKLVPFVYDIYPDIAVEMGFLKNRAVINLFKLLEKLMYRWSAKVIVLSEKFKQNLVTKKGVIPEKIGVIPLWLDKQAVAPMSRDNPWRKAVGIPENKFVVLYSGTIGWVSGVEVVLEAARELTRFPDILFLLVGAGHAKDQLESRVEELNLTNFKFLPLQPREHLSELQATADVSLVTLAKGRGRTSIPSKLLGYMAAGRPVIASVDLDCDTAQMVRESGCGQVVPPAQGKLLAEAILHYYHNPEERAAAGGKGRDFFMVNFERRRILQEYVKLIENV